MNYMRIIFKKFKARMIVGCILAVIALLAVSVIVFINQASFGRTPRGERLERVMKSPNYRNGEFKNQHETLLMTSDRGRFSGIWEFIFRKIDGLRPEQAVKAIKTDLRKIGRNEEILVWFGHSSYLIQTGGKRILVDPVFRMASPVSFVNKPFKGTELYTPDDMPDIDYLVISHDHWDHLDYRLIRQMKVAKYQSGELIIREFHIHRKFNCSIRTTEYKVFIFTHRSCRCVKVCRQQAFSSSPITKYLFFSMKTGYSVLCTHHYTSIYFRQYCKYSI